MNTIQRLTIIFLMLMAGTPLLAQEATSAHQPIPYDSLQAVLEEIYDLDQEIRLEFMQQMQEGAALDTDLVHRMNRIDSVNQVRIKQILKEYGWLPQSQVGEKAASALFLVIQHADLPTMRRYLPDLRAATEAGEADPTWAALMEDRVLMYEGKQQRYGTQASSREREDGTTEYFIWPIESPEEVNQLRAQAGFDLTVEENADRLKAVYNPAEELPQ